MAVRAVRFLVLSGILATAASVAAAEQNALVLSHVARLRHMPFGTVLDPVFETPTSDSIVGYTRCGDSAIWTGHYLAGEAFRYAVTGSGEALDNVRFALDGLRGLVDVTGTELLARCSVPVDSPFAADIIRQESHHDIHVGMLNGTEHFWVGSTSRDQYLGVLFGFAVAFDLVGDADVRSSITALCTRLLNFLLRNDWNVRMPNGRISTTFLHRPDQQLTLLQIGRLIDPARFGSTYSTYRFFKAGSVLGPIAFDSIDDHNSYFKFNLNTINFYNLIRLEDSAFYRRVYEHAYRLMRRITGDHGNPHFNMIDRAITGPDPTRDANTLTYLNEWLVRPRRDPFVDLRNTLPACGAPDRACEPIPIPLRVTTDFLWQRSPFLLFGGGDGRIEGPGIDYILPYWMARYYDVAPGP